jgi:hypothetical protein
MTMTMTTMTQGYVRDPVATTPRISRRLDPSASSVDTVTGEMWSGAGLATMTGRPHRNLSKIVPNRYKRKRDSGWKTTTTTLPLGRVGPEMSNSPCLAEYPPEMRRRLPWGERMRRSPWISAWFVGASAKMMMIRWPDRNLSPHPVTVPWFRQMCFFFGTAHSYEYTWHGHNLVERHCSIDDTMTMTAEPLET